MPAAAADLAVTLAVVAAILAGLAALPVGIHLKASYRGPGRGDEAKVEVSVLGDLTLWRTAIPMLSFERRGGTLGVVTEAARRVGPWRRKSDAGAAPQARDLARIWVDLARKAVWRRLSWATTVGLGSAAETALVAGGLWVLKGWLGAWAARNLRLGPGQPEFTVVPDFSGGGLVSAADGIGVLRVGHIIIALPGLIVALSHLFLTRRAGGGRPGKGR